MGFAGDPEAEVVVHLVGGQLGELVGELRHVVEREVAVLEQHPVTVRDRGLHVLPRVHLLSLAHRDDVHLCGTNRLNTE